jgi:hypothetical protein
MTATHWLLLGLIFMLAVCIFVICMINAEWRGIDQPSYRTADGAAIVRQTRRIIATANTSIIASDTVSAQASAQPSCCCALATTRHQGAAADQRGAA